MFEGITVENHTAESILLLPRYSTSQVIEGSAVAFSTQFSAKKTKNKLGVLRKRCLSALQEFGWEE